MTTETVVGPTLQQFGDMAFQALGTVQETVKDQRGIRDGNGTSIVESFIQSAAVRDVDDSRVTVSVQLALPEAGDLSWMAFKACSYALYTACREKLKPEFVWDGPRRRVPAGSTVRASMKIGKARMRVMVVVGEPIP